MPARAPRPNPAAGAADALGRVAPLAGRWIERLLAACEPPLTPAQYLALEAVAEGEMVGSELARRAAVSAAAVSQLITGLEAAGLVTRRRSAEDRRRQPLRLTAAGEQALEAARALLTERLGELIATLPPPEQSALGAALERLEQLLGGHAPPPHPRPPLPPGRHPAPPGPPAP
jgi:DNA-binding MarR family transcriptional regulator